MGRTLLGVRGSDWYRVITTLPLEPEARTHTHLPSIFVVPSFWLVQVISFIPRKRSLLHTPRNHMTERFCILLCFCLATSSTQERTNIPQPSQDLYWSGFNFFSPPWWRHGMAPMAIRVSGQRQKNGASLLGEIAKWLLRFSGDHHLTTPDTSIHPCGPRPSSARTLFSSRRHHRRHCRCSRRRRRYQRNRAGGHRRRRCPRVAAATAAAESSAAAFSCLLFVVCCLCPLPSLSLSPPPPPPLSPSMPPRP